MVMMAALTFPSDNSSISVMLMLASIDCLLIQFKKTLIPRMMSDFFYLNLAILDRYMELGSYLNLLFYLASSDTALAQSRNDSSLLLAVGSQWGKGREGTPLLQDRGGLSRSLPGLH